MLELWRLLLLVSVFLLCTIPMVSDDAAKPPAVAAPPTAESKPVEDVVHGRKIVDPYRWLEDASSPQTQRWVSEELAYTRSLLDPLPGRSQLGTRLEQLMFIGTISAPQPAGKYYFYTRREGRQNQPVLYVREGVNGADRV